ncbi:MULTISPECIES: DNA cytosine methyltransferase [Rhizobium/Agrobacterium group]|uniref:DNA-cytosine methyltransferase n=1 Tax=Allorhizobium ampelinum (strain ATCC BAA-846 / DSM 112012 / S4) TaxID=311402 RepID=B9K2R6_ALLAM|nr:MULTISPECIES: DNA cytosine methyltransferase [Rhizobium/Agrobacterium group]ACM39164.1 DNA-cytosine methyltransferase [Allorhizobium ampelinum S4]MUO30797.1 DNA cytosine methyltransferase [Agrobacterium vitis]
MNVALHPQHTNIISLCTGGGGLDLAVELAVPSARTVCMVEREGFACGALVSAMEAGLMAPAPVWSDARTFNGRPWRGLVDGLIGGIPCQPHSLAGKRRGQEDERDLWSVARRIIVQSGAWFVLIENVRGMLSSGGAERVWRDFQRLGFSVEGGLFRASEVGASHERERLFILAVANAIGERRFAGRDDNGINDRCIVDATGRKPLADSIGERGAAGVSGPQQPGKPGDAREPFDGSGVVADATGEGWQGREPAEFVRQGEQDATFERGGSPLVHSIGSGCAGRTEVEKRGSSQRVTHEWSGRTTLFPPRPDDFDGWRSALAASPELEPSFCRVADGLASRLDIARVDRLRLLGNGVVPLEGAYAFRTLVARLAARGSASAARLLAMKVTA